MRQDGSDGCGGNQVCQTFPQAPGQSLLDGGYWLLLQSQGVLKIYQEIRFLDLEGLHIDIMHVPNTRTP